MGCGCGAKIRPNLVKQVTKRTTIAKQTVKTTGGVRRRIIKRPAR